MKTAKRLSFYKFAFENFRHEATRAGDLTRDMLDDAHFPKDARTKKEFENHLWDVSDEALEGFAAIWRAYSAYRRDAYKVEG